MTTSEIELIASPADGLIVYSTTDKKLYVYNSLALVWKEISFGTGTISPPFVCGTSYTDSRDSKAYTTVQIGTQCWMAQNLAYLPSVTDLATPASNTDPFYYVNGYDGNNVAAAKATANYQTYGALYNWPAAVAACPTGWHLPTDVEWSTLTTYLGESVTGGAMKETGTAHWTTPNLGASNTSGFTGLPGGYRLTIFNNIGYYGYFWSSTEASANYGWIRYLYYNNANVNRSSDTKGFGISVRCVRD
jgi:uncharacterized protein (TIGR02145 family)